MIAAEADEPAAPRPDAEATAATMVYRRLLREGAPAVLAIIILNYLVFGYYVTMFVTGWVIAGGFTGGARVLAMACLILALVAAIATGLHDLAQLRTLIKNPRVPELPAGWRAAAAEFTNRRAWCARVLTAPLVALVGVNFVQLGAPVAATALIAGGAWLLPDLLRLARTHVRIRQQPFVALLAPASIDPLEGRQP